MEQLQFTETDLIAFGNYLLSPERKAAYKANPLKGHTLKERLATVNDADVKNFQDKINGRTG